MGKSKKKKKSKTKKPTKKKSSRKRKAYETDISYSSSDEPAPKRPRLSQIIVKPTSVPPDNTNVRRSKRVRFKPLDWWRNERIDNPNSQPLEYEDVKSKGFEGELDYEPGSKAQDSFVNKKKTKRSRRKPKSKAVKKKKSKRSKKSKKGREEQSSSPEPMSEDEPSDDDEEENTTPFDGTAWIYDSKNDKMAQNCVVKTQKCINLMPLGAHPDNEDGESEKVPVSKQVRGAKGLEEEGFSCGVLEIPPESQKHAEVSYYTEQFFVHQCEKKKLIFKLGEDEFVLSRGSMFYVPPENEYSLRNLSKTHPVKIIFTLIKKPDDMMDSQTQSQSQTQNTPLR